MKNILLIITVLSLFQLQSFSQEVVSSAGHYDEALGVQLNWTIGEPIITTSIGSGFILTQGFQQSYPVASLYSLDLSFDAGWNIMSMRVLPYNLNMMDILQPLIDANSLIKVMNESGNSIEDWGIFGGWQNQIGNIQSTEGYKIKVNEASVLSMNGKGFIYPFNIQLMAGWNIISWPTPNEQDGMEVFQTLINEGKLLKVMNESGNSIEDWGIFGGWQNHIGNLQSGEGYKVKVNETCILTINEFGTKSNYFVPEFVLSNHFKPGYLGNGTNHMNINVVNLTESGFTIGDEIGIFDGDLCVGSALLTEQSIMNNKIGIPASADDNLVLVNNGFKNGDSIVFRLYRDNKEYILNGFSINKKQNTFEKNETLLTMLNFDINTSVEMPETDFRLSCYPNPFNEFIKIQIYLPNHLELTVDIYDAQGRQIKQLYKGASGQLLTLRWDGENSDGKRVPTGIYLCRANNVWKKIILLEY